MVVNVDDLAFRNLGEYDKVASMWLMAASRGRWPADAPTAVGTANSPISAPYQIHRQFLPPENRRAAPSEKETESESRGTHASRVVQDRTRNIPFECIPGVKEENTSYKVWQAEKHSVPQRRCVCCVRRGPRLVGNSGDGPVGAGARRRRRRQSTALYSSRHTLAWIRRCAAAAPKTLISSIPTRGERERTAPPPLPSLSRQGAQHPLLFKPVFLHTYIYKLFRRGA